MKFSNLLTKYFLIILIVLAPISSVWAIDLESAKSQGLVGELQNGYLAPIDGQASTEINNLVSNINTKRKAEYNKIAEASGTTVIAVEALAGKKAIEKTVAGNYVQNSNGKMQKK